MCKICENHGAKGKWYNNAKNYLKETAVEAHTYEYLEELWGNLERAYIRKVHGILNMKGLSKRANTPLIGRFLKWYANRGFMKDGRKKNLVLKAEQGHLGQVLPLEEAKFILREFVEEAAIYYCPCKYFNRGLRETSCLAFSPLIEVLPKLPRYIPENGLEIIDAEKAESFLDKMAKKGYVQSVWCGPVPAIIGICNCDIQSCGALRLRQFGVNACLKSEYVAVVNSDKCIGCRICVSVCQFGALSFIPSVNRPIIKPELCFGCALCQTRCENDAIQLVDRNEIPITRGQY